MKKITFKQYLEAIIIENSEDPIKDLLYISDLNKLNKILEDFIHIHDKAYKYDYSFDIINHDKDYFCRDLKKCGLYNMYDHINIITQKFQYIIFYSSSSYIGIAEGDDYYYEHKFYISKLNTVPISQYINMGNKYNIFSKPINNMLGWIEIETTGIYSCMNHILEIACVVTDINGISVNDGISIVIHKPGNIPMNDTYHERHRTSGLINKVKESIINLPDAENTILNYLNKHIIVPGKSPMCGNNIHINKSFLCQHMPVLNFFFNDQSIDVGTLKTITEKWKLMPKFERKNNHSLLHNIHESIKEYQYYKEYMSSEY